MRLLWEIIEFMACFIEIFIAYKMMEIVFSARNPHKMQKEMIIFALIGAVVIRICNMVSLFSYFTMFVFVIFTAVSGAFIYKENYITILSVASFYMLCISGFDFLVLTITSSFYQGTDTLNVLLSELGPLRAAVVLIIKALWITVYLILKKYLKKISFSIRGTYATLLTSIIGYCGFVFLVEQTMRVFDHTMPWIWVMFVCILALLMFAVYFMIEWQREKMALNFRELQGRLLEDNYKTLSDIYIENAKLYHDLNNHLNILYQLLEEDEGKAAKDYIREISRPVLKLSQTRWTGVDIVDVIINSKLEKMKQHGIEADINVEYPADSNIMPNDMCTILSNLMDNAIEAAAGVEPKGYIFLTMRRIHYFLLIKVENTCKGSMKSFDDIPNTTKDNKNLHGWGLRSVRDTVKKYSGTMECQAKDGIFAVKIMMQWENKN